MAFSIVASVASSGRIQVDVVVFGQRLSWFTEIDLPTVTVESWFKTFDLETVTGLPIADISGLPITVEVFIWRTQGGSVSLGAMEIWNGETSTQSNYLATTDNP
jgi:hypothetical protein